MKYSAAAALLFVAPVAASTVPVADEQWQPIYQELSQCINSMGWCMDEYHNVTLDAEERVPLNSRVEMNYKSRERCLRQSMHSWREPYPTVGSFKLAVETQNDVDTTFDLIALRRSAGVPVYGGLAREVVSQVPGASLEGYTRCGDREYVFMYGEKAALYNTVGQAFETIDVNGAAAQIPTFDAAFSMPMSLRISPYAIISDELFAGEGNSKCTDKPIVNVELGNQNIEPFVPCADDVEIQLIVVAVEGRRLEEVAERVERHLTTHGRHLLGEAVETLTAKVTGARHITVSGIKRHHAGRLLAAESLEMSLGADSSVVHVNIKDKYMTSNYNAALVTQSRSVRDDDGLFSESMDETPLWAAGIRGQGQVVGVGDSGLAIDHCMFSDPNMAIEKPAIGENKYYDGHRKIVNYFAYADNVPAESDHGTHCAGTVLGNALSGPELTVGHHGMAQEAKISFLDIGIAGQPFLNVPDDIEAGYLQHMFDAGARISSHSWGSPYGNHYSAYAQGMDNFMWEHQDVMVLVAAGNSNFHRGSQGSLGAPSTNKNGVCVGASMTTDPAIEIDMSAVFGRNFTCSRWSTSDTCEESLAYFSSNGPASDGRIAPTLVAPGFVTLSANSDSECGLSGKAGTSMATPAAAGNLALVRQYFQEGMYPTGSKTVADGFTPMGALLKAVAVNSATKIGGTYSTPAAFAEKDTLSNMALPSMEFGFGLMKLDNTLLIDGHAANVGRELYVDGDFSDAPEVDLWKAVKYTFNAPTSGEMKITLVWSDYPAMLSAREHLVNDIDLEVTDKDGNRWFPNNANSVDTLNTVEQVVLSGVQGEVTVRVVGKSVPFGPQPYALVVSGAGFAMVGNKVVESLTIDEIKVSGSVDEDYFAAWLAGGVVMGGLMFFTADQYASKKRMGSGVRPSSTESDVSKEQSVVNPIFDSRDI